MDRTHRWLLGAMSDPGSNSKKWKTVLQHQGSEIWQWSVSLEGTLSSRGHTPTHIQLDFSVVGSWAEDQLTSTVLQDAGKCETITLRCLSHCVCANLFYILSATEVPIESTTVSLQAYECLFSEKNKWVTNSGFSTGFWMFYKKVCSPN